MKKLFTVIMLTLAMNFLALAGGVGWLYQQGRLDREKLLAVKGIIFPKPAEEAPSTQPSETGDSTTQPTLRLEELLAKASGRSASEQVEFIQNAFSARMVQLERRQRELLGLQQSVELAKQQLTHDRAAFDGEKKAFESREQQTAQLASDKGFQDSLTLYNTMPAKQVKTVFMTLDDQTVLRYLQAMQPRTASKIVGEFKAPAEQERIQKILKQLAPNAPQAPQASAKE